MAKSNASQSQQRKVLTARRLTLLASAAGLGVAMLVAGPSGYVPASLRAWTSTAHAADETAIQHPASFADLVAKVKPAVISVRVKIDESKKLTSMTGESEDLNPFARSSPMGKFFQQFGLPNMPNEMIQPHETVIAEGSGFFISPDGYAVTNNHVVAHAKSVQVTTSDGSTYIAKVVGIDPKTDLALLKVDGNNDFPYVRFAEHKARVGDWVIAVGNPYGLGNTVTAGIVSAQSRDIGSNPYDDYMQIDAPINKGNSGGPTFNTNGNVVGVNTAIYSPSGGSVGIGFDIPASTVKLVVAQLKAKGYVSHGWLGIEIQSVTSGIANSLGMKKAEGAMVDQPQADSPAAAAGIISGDVITAVNDTPVKDSRELAREIGMMAPNTSVKLDILRNGETKILTVTLGQMPGEHLAKAETEHAAPTNTAPYLGLMLTPANEVAGSGNKGVVVTGVDPNGPAAGQGLKAGNVILDVGGEAVANAADVRNALIAAKDHGKRDVLMRVKSANATLFVAVPLQQKAG
jgi:serine protease Do